MEHYEALPDHKLQEFIKQSQDYIDLLELQITFLQSTKINPQVIKDLEKHRSKLLLVLMKVIALLDERTILRRKKTLFQYGQN
jgi:hypothetical protein